MIRTIKNNIAVLAVAFIFSVPAVSFAGGPIQPSGSKSQSVVRSIVATHPQPHPRPPVINLLQDLKRIISELKAMKLLETTPPAKPTNFTLIANKLIANSPGQVAFKFTGDACGASGLKCSDMSGAGIVRVTISGSANNISQTKIVEIDRDFVGRSRSMNVEIRPGDKVQFRLDALIRLNSALESLPLPGPTITVFYHSTHADIEAYEGKDFQGVFSDQKSYGEAWNQLINVGDGFGNKLKPPAVDFSQERVLALATRVYSTGGYDLIIDSIEIKDGKIRVKVRMTSPGPEDIRTQALTRPIIFAKIPKGNLPVEVVDLSGKPWVSSPNV